MEDERLDFLNRNTFKSSPEYACYNVFCADRQLTKIHKNFAKFSISNLVHYTSVENYASILKECIVRPGKRRLLGDLGSFQLSWWSLSYDPQTDAECITYVDAMEERGSPNLGEYKKLLRSCPFSSFSRYGNYGVSVPILSLLKLYEESVLAKCQLRILWTYVYQWEFMHTVLVIPENMSSTFEKLPLLDTYMTTAAYPVVQRRGKNGWVWCPQLTSVMYPDSSSIELGGYKHWDHLTFVFVIPEHAEWCEGIHIPPKFVIGNLMINNISIINLSPDKGRVCKYDALRDLRQKNEEEIKKCEAMLANHKELRKKLGDLGFPEYRKKNPCEQPALTVTNELNVFTDFADTRGELGKKRKLNGYDEREKITKRLDFREMTQETL